MKPKFTFLYVMLVFTVACALAACSAKPEEASPATQTQIATATATATTTPAPTLTPVPPTVTPTLTAIPPTATATPTEEPQPAAGNFDGDYYGVTAQGLPFNFTIADNALVTYTVGFNLPNCDGVSPISVFMGTPQDFISGDTLEHAGPAVSFTATFIEGTGATGMIVIAPALCNSRLTLEWNALNGVPLATQQVPAVFADAIPEMEIPAELFSPETGTANVDGFTPVLMEQGDWLLISAFGGWDSILPIPRGWSTTETFDGTYIRDVPFGQLPAIKVDIGYYQDDEGPISIDEMMLLIQTRYAETETRKWLASTIINEDQGYILVDSTNSEGHVTYIIIVSRNPNGIFHIFFAMTFAESWAAYFPVIQAMVGHWLTPEGAPLSVILPDELGALVKE